MTNIFPFEYQSHSQIFYLPLRDNNISNLNKVRVLALSIAFSIAAKHEIGMGKMVKEDSKHHVEKQNKKHEIS